MVEDVLDGQREMTRALEAPAPARPPRRRPPRSRASRQRQVRATIVFTLLGIAVVLDEYAAEFRLARPPRAVQRVLLPPLALLGRALGYGAARPG
jgi:hypothetical protein